eukprot:4073231-Prymnesium_polylepis.1
MYLYALPYCTCTILNPKTTNATTPVALASPPPATRCLRALRPGLAARARTRARNPRGSGGARGWP